MDLLFQIHLLISLYMVGLIWFVQVVHYPLFQQVGPDYFPAYERQHTRRTGWITAPPMLIEMLTGVGLALTATTHQWGWWTNLGIILLLWISTFFIQIPLHGKLSKRYDENLARRLVRTNWIRTVLWTVKGVAVLAGLANWPPG